MRNPFTTPEHEDVIREKRAERGISWEQYASELETHDPAVAAWMRAQDAAGDDAPPAADAPVDDAGDAPVDDAPPADDEPADEPPTEPAKPARERAPRGRKAAGPNAKA